MLELKQALQTMFVSREWSSCAWAKKPEGKEVKKIVMDDRNFWPGVVYCIKTTQPLVEVLRIVDGERSPAMGFIYGTIDEAKMKISKNLDGQVSSYKEIWDIIDLKWERQLHRDLHATAYYLNPRYRWSEDVSHHPEIKSGLYRCMDRLVKDLNTYAKIDKQLDEFVYQRGLFGFRASKSSYLTRPPVIWWENFGDEVPELKAFAMKILGLTCSASACERNWSTFNQVHTKRRNRLSTKKLNSLVYIMYNKKLKDKHLKKQSRKDDVDPLIVEDVPSDDEWIADPNDEDEVLHIEYVDEGGCSSASRKRKGTHSTQTPTSKGKETTSRFAMIDEDAEHESGGEDVGSDGNGGEDGSADAFFWNF